MLRYLMRAGLTGILPQFPLSAGDGLGKRRWLSQPAGDLYSDLSGVRVAGGLIYRYFMQSKD